MIHSRFAAVPLALLALAVSALAGGVFAENIDPLNVGDQYAYGENAGWINAEPANCANCGMQVNDTSVTGYMWGENIGWVNLNCSNDGSCGGAAGNWGVTNDNTGNLKGYAWSENSGWINFSCLNNSTCGGTGNYGVHINPLTGDFSGRAWSENEGWITFAATSPVAYKVKTSWVQTSFQVNINDDVDNGSCTLVHCSLREAINATNASPGANTITFNIPGAGVHTITPAAALPSVTDPVTIDATTQPGYTTSPLIELNGTSAGASVNGLTITTGGTTVEGLAINRFTGSGIALSGSTATGDTIQKNYIGTNAAGTAALGNTLYGVQVGAGAHDNTIGGATSAARNVLSGNSSGFYFLATAGSGNLLKNNYIGTNAAGSSAIANTSDGVTVQTSVSSTIDSNLISGNARFGIYMLGPSANVTVNSNTIGLSATNTPLGNVAAGIFVINSTSNQITNNTIASNVKGIIINTAASGTRLSANSIFNNTGLGIDLDDDGVTANDAGDADTGGNNHQNFPVLSSARTSGGSTTVNGSLNSTASTAFTIEFFSNPACDGSGNGEGQVFLGSLSPVTTDGSGNMNFTKSGLPAVTVGQVVTATATRNSAPLDTSEFSACSTVIAGTQADLSVTKSALPNPAKMANPLTYTVTVNNGGSAGATGVNLTDTLPGTVTFVSATPSQGSCSQSLGVVTCPLGSIANGGNATVSIIVTPTTGNPLVNTASVSGNESDPNNANNTVTITTPALWKCTRSDATVVYRGWPTPAGDDDCDGFTTTAENFAGTLPLVACSPTTSPDHAPDEWPVDFNNDQHANLSDVLKYSPVFNTTGPGLPYLVRFDLNGDNHINLSDVLKFSPFFNQTCANP